MSVLGMFARNPQPGKTKTRLAATIGDQAAADLYDCFVRDLAARVSGLADQFWTAVTPDSADCRQWYRTLPHAANGDRCRLLIQPEGDLGQRIRWFFAQAAEEGIGPAILIGTDNPDLPSDRIEEAMELLSMDSADIVIVPATDGGYVLIGLNGSPGTLFDKIRWSSPFTMLDTLAAAEAAGKRSQVLSLWYDIDDIEDLGTLAALQTCPGRSSAAPCPLTAKRLPKVLSEVAAEDG